MSNKKVRKFDGENDEYASFERASELIWDQFLKCMINEEYDRISDRSSIILFTAAVKIFSRKCIDEDRSFRPLAGRYDEVVTATEALAAATELLRALRLGPTEFALWSRRRPEDYHDIPSELSDDLKVNMQ